MNTLDHIKTSQDVLHTEVLTPEEIDKLLSAIYPGNRQYKGFENIADFETYLKNRKFNPEKPYGIFYRDVATCRFFDSGNNDNLLADIKKKNEEQRLGNIKIPNTNIMLINYSFCPRCKTTYSFGEVIDYYKNPKPDIMFKNKAHQYCYDTRVFCNNCDTFFIPSLIIADGTPIKEVQFLCKVQTIKAVENYMSSKNVNVLTKDKKNIMYKGKLRAIKNDISIMDLEEKPTLITNMIQYTPFRLISNFIDGSNIEKNDLIFDEWKEAI